MKNIIFSISLFLSLLILLTSFTEANLNHKKFKRSIHSNVIKGKYIIEVNGHDNVDQLVNTLSTTFDSQILRIHKRFKYDVFSGLVFQLDQTIDYQQQLESILDSDYIVAAYPSTILQRDKNKVNDNKFKHNQTKYSYTPLTKPEDIKKILPHHLTQVDRVHKELGLTGKGIRVCVVDSGIDYNHPALGGGFGKGYKVSLGADLIGDHFNLETGKSETLPNKTPIEACDSFKSMGHGTHVSGIIAGKYKEFIGGAPDVELGVWRVFDCLTQGSVETILEGFLEADKADCDIINASIGFVNSWEESFFSDIINRISEKGRHVIASAANYGFNGLFTVGQPSNMKNVMSVAAFQNSYDIVKQFKATGIDDAIDFNCTTREINTVYIDGELVQGNGLQKDLDSNETCYTPIGVENKYVLLKVSNNDTCTLNEKMKLLEKKGALASIYYFEEDTIPVVIDTDIPGLYIKDSKYGDILNNQLEDRKVHIKFTGQYTKKAEGAGKVTYFSSYGPTYELNLRPHLGGIGGRIYSTLPGYLNGWGEMDGTSMSAPYLASCVALYLEYARKNGLSDSPSYVIEHFQNYALPVTPPLSNNTEASLLDTPIHQGAGLVQLYDTITELTHVTPSSISFNDTASATEYKSHVLTITNNGNDPISYKVSNKPSYSIDPYEIEKHNYTLIPFVKYNSLKAKLIMSKITIQVQPHQSVRLKVTVVPPKGNETQHPIYGGYIYFQSSKNQTFKDISIPYFGVIGKQKNIPLFRRVYFTANMSTMIPIPLNETIDCLNGSNLTIINILDMGTRYLIKEIINKETKKVIGYLEPPQYYVGRSVVQVPFEAFSFNGTYIPSLSSSLKERVPIPRGVYNVVYKALRIFGNIDEPKDFDHWVSNDIVIKNN